MIGYTIEQIYDWVVAMALTTTRPAALFALLPVLSRELVGSTARNAIVLAFSLPALPLVQQQIAEAAPIGGFLIVGMLFKEMVLGTLMAFGIAAAFWIATGIGDFIDTQRGTSIGETFNPLLESSSSPSGTFFERYLVVLFVVSGGLGTLLQSLYSSYLVWPATSLLTQPNEAFLHFIIEYISTLLYNIVILASPVILAMFLVQLGLALANRFAQQLNVFSISLPLMSLTGLIVLSFYLLALTQLMQGHLDDIAFWPQRVRRMFE